MAEAAEGKQCGERWALQSEDRALTPRIILTHTGKSENTGMAAAAGRRGAIPPARPRRPLPPGPLPTPAGPAWGCPFSLCLPACLPPRHGSTAAGTRGRESAFGEGLQAPGPYLAAEQRTQQRGRRRYLSACGWPRRTGPGQAQPSRPGERGRGGTAPTVPGAPPGRGPARPARGSRRPGVRRCRARRSPAVSVSVSVSVSVQLAGHGGGTQLWSRVHVAKVKCAPEIAAASRCGRRAAPLRVLGVTFPFSQNILS